MCGEPTKGAARREEEEFRKRSKTKSIRALWRVSVRAHNHTQGGRPLS